MDADAAIRAVVSRLPPSDVAYLLEARGIPARSGRPDCAAAALAAALTDEMVEWEWEAGDVGPSGYHAPIVGAGGSLVVIPGAGDGAGAIFFFGGLNADRIESSDLWKWDLSASSPEGFTPVVPAGGVAPSFTSGHFAAAGPDGRLYVFPGPRNAEVDRAFAFDPATSRWDSLEFEGVGPTDPAARRAVVAVPQPGGGALLALGGPASAHTIHRFTWATRAWEPPIHVTGGPPDDGRWVFGGAAFQPEVGRVGGPGRVIMWGATSPAPSATAADDGPPVQVFALDWPARAWVRLPDGPAPPPPLRTHAAGAITCGRLLLQGGRRPGAFNVTADCWEYDLVGGCGWQPLFASEVRGGGGGGSGGGGAWGGAPGPAAREWHAAVGLADCAVFVGGRTAIPYDDLSPDTMATAVQCLWSRAKPSTPGADGDAPASAARRPAPPIGRAATLAALASAGPPAGSLADPTVDVVLVAAGGEPGSFPGRFPAHRWVLAAHSAVFAAMWASPMKEGGSSGGRDVPPEIGLPDVAPASAAALLAYCYGSAPSLPSSVKDLTALFEAADKYDMPGLVAECVAGLRSRAHPSHVAGLLAVADARQCAALRGVVAETAAKALPAVLANPSFTALVKDAPGLGLGLISEVVRKLGVGDGGEEDGADGRGGGASEDDDSDDGDDGADAFAPVSPRSGASGGDAGAAPVASPRADAAGGADHPTSAPATPTPSPPPSPRGAAGPAAPPTPAQ